MASRNAVPLDPNAGIPDLIRRLTDDSKRLAQDEVRLAKLELRDGLHDAARGAVWLGVAFGVGVVALTAFTIFLSAGLGRLFGNYWAGTLVTAVLLLGGAALLVTRGLKALKEPSYTFEQTRETVSETARQLRPSREPALDAPRGPAVPARPRPQAPLVERAD